MKPKFTKHAVPTASKRRKAAAPAKRKKAPKEHAFLRVAKAPLRAASRQAAAVTAGFSAVIHGFTGLIASVAGDIKHGFLSIVNGIVVLATAIVDFVKAVFRAIGHVAAKIASPVINPIRETFTAKAKEAYETEYATTPDHKSHKELIVLAVGTVLIISGAFYWVSAGPTSGISLGGLLSVFSPSNVISRVSSYSPEKMVVFAAFLLAFMIAVWFWIRMVADSFRREYPSQVEKTRWQLVTLFFFVPGAIAYFVRVYNHWTMRQFVGYHFISVMTVSVAIVVGVSTYGSLYYFNQKAEAQAKPAQTVQVPNLEVDENTKKGLLNRTKYGQPLTQGVTGRTDPFAPIPGLDPVASPSPSPSASPEVSAPQNPQP